MFSRRSFAAALGALGLAAGSFSRTASAGLDIEADRSAAEAVFRQTRPSRSMSLDPLDGRARILAKERLSAGLPAELPGAISDAELQSGGFVRFAGVAGGAHGMPPPIGDSILVDGAEADEAALSEIFADDHWARLPEGSRIRRGRVNGKEAWEFPAGMRIVHRFYVRGSPSWLFEFRVIEKRADGKWAFGAYLPRPDGSLGLRSGTEEAAFQFPRPARPAKILVRRTHTESCRHCHWMLADGDIFPEEDFVGPCGFGPDNPHLTGRWAAEHRDRRGWWPFEDSDLALR